MKYLFVESKPAQSMGLHNHASALFMATDPLIRDSAPTAFGFAGVWANNSAVRIPPASS
jgi:hypothetical protein